jgi:hypothetical protein
MAYVIEIAGDLLASAEKPASEDAGYGKSLQLAHATNRSGLF